MEKARAEMGFSMSTAFTIFARKAAREGRLPSAISAHPFCSGSNTAFMRRGMAEPNAGKGPARKLTDELIEE